MTKIYVYAWDLDETIGNFLELGMFWDALNQYYNYTLSELDFHNILDIFPGFFRPDIFNSFKILKKIKNRYPNVKVMIYTNNQGPDTWALWISHYIEKQIGYKLFDQIIKTYKIGNRIVEKCRTSHEKNMPDLLRCTGLPSDTEVCFFDDQPHLSMKKSSRVKYVYLVPYIYSMPFDAMIKMYLSSYKKNKLIANVYKFTQTMQMYLARNRYKQKVKTQQQYQSDINMKLYIKKSIGQFASKFRVSKQSKIWKKVRNDTPHPIQYKTRKSNSRLNSIRNKSIKHK